MIQCCERQRDKRPKLSEVKARLIEMSENTGTCVHCFLLLISRILKGKHLLLTLVIRNNVLVSNMFAKFVREPKQYLGRHVAVGLNPVGHSQFFSLFHSWNI